MSKAKESTAVTLNRTNQFPRLALEGFRRRHGYFASRSDHNELVCDKLAISCTKDCDISGTVRKRCVKKVLNMADMP